MNIKALRRAKKGFTLIELLVVIAIIAILAAILLPVLSKAEQKAQGIECMSNEKQLAAAWIMYSGDNQGRLVRNGAENDQKNLTSDTDPSLLTGTNSQWCPGRQDTATTSAGLQLSPAGTSPGSNAGYQWIEAGMLFPYVKNLGLYKCPADNSSFVLFAGKQLPHVRSMSMNQWLSPVQPWNNNTTLVHYYTESSLRNPGPANLWVFVDENQWGINDGSFIVDYTDTGNWVDYPAVYHHFASGMSFADGHAEIHRWHDPTVIYATQGSINQQNGENQQNPPQQTPSPADLIWFQNASSALVN